MITKMYVMLFCLGKKKQQQKNQASESVNVALQDHFLFECGML